MVGMIVTIVVLVAVTGYFIQRTARDLWTEYKVHLYMQGYHDGRELRFREAEERSREESIFNFVKNYGKEKTK